MGNSDYVVSGNYTFLFADTAEIIPNIISVTFTEANTFDKLTYLDENETEVTLDVDQYTYTDLVLDIPGVGYAYSGDIVYVEQFRQKPSQFQLLFGWHENVSNQKIFSWYLKPTPDSNVDYIKTLYYEDLTNIVGVNHTTEGNVILDNRYDPPYNYLNEFVKIIGVLFKDFTINDDLTCTFTSIDGDTHTLTPIYENDKIVSLLYDGYQVNMTFDDNGVLTNLGGTDFDISAYNGGV